MKIRKIIALVLLVFIASGIFSSCSDAQETVPADDEASEIAQTSEETLEMELPSDEYISEIACYNVWLGEINQDENGKVTIEVKYSMNPEYKNALSGLSFASPMGVVEAILQIDENTTIFADDGYTYQYMTDKDNSISGIKYSFVFSTNEQFETFYVKFNYSGNGVTRRNVRFSMTTKKVVEMELVTGEVLETEPLTEEVLETEPLTEEVLETEPVTEEPLVVVQISDKALENAIREKIGKKTGDIYKSDLDEITSLFLDDYTEVRDISALSDLTNLTYLNMGGTQVTDISALSTLIKLKTLRFHTTAVSDISALSNLTNLTELDMGGTQVTDISALSNLIKLKTLRFYITAVSDISALSNLTNLKELDMAFTQVGDISALRNLTNLTELTMLFTEVSDTSALSNLTNLTGLYMGDTKVSDISMLSNFTNLIYLGLSNTKVSDISALSNLTNLRTLNLSNTQVPQAQIDALKAANPNLEITQ